uniref:Protein wntless homolog n=1 Tax=Phallusia mammillata TaxID=59560 RepID=A0A6F9DXR1_9ASCI|nr:protein wntless homolog [Phallusia mammillata]
MAGAVIETLSTKKLVAMVLGLVVLEIGFVILGGIVAPNPTMSIVLTATTCINNKSQDWILPETCEQMELDPKNHQETISHQGPDDNPKHDPNNVVFAVVVPKKDLEMSRWFQYMLTLAIFRIPYNIQHEVAPDAMATLDIRLAYSNDYNSYKSPKSWQSVVNSTQERPLECVFEHPKTYEYTGFEYNCDPLFISQLGSLPHKHYLINIRLPVNKAHPKISPNMKIGQVTEIDFVAVTQTGGFTYLWVCIKATLCVVMIFPCLWYWRKLSTSDQPATLTEKAIFALGLGMLFLNGPFELVTIFTDASWMLMITDLRQGLFYALLCTFWVIYINEHFKNKAKKNKLSVYKWQLAVIILTCFAFTGLKLAERGSQLSHPASILWQSPKGALTIFVCQCIAGVLFFLHLCFLVIRGLYLQRFRQFTSSVRATTDFKSFVNRYLMLTLLSIGTSGMTVAYFIFGLQLEGWLVPEITLPTSSVFYIGVYGLWNLYALLVLLLYAPSNKVSNVFYIDDTNNLTLDSDEVSIKKNRFLQTVNKET